MLSAIENDFSTDLPVDIELRDGCYSQFGNTFVIAGGSDNGNLLNYVLAYDPYSANKWIKLGSLQKPRSGCAAMVLPDYMAECQK